MNRLLLILALGFCPVLYASVVFADNKVAPRETTQPPWPADVPGFVPPAGGEHPRLLFRKSDLPELKRRAATPEGQYIVARLKELLGGGETMPTSYNRSTKAYEGNAAAGGDDESPSPGKKKSKGVQSGSEIDLPVGAYTISHAAGFGMLYQLTGEAKYAELGRQCFEKAFAGVRDRDDRYSWKVPGGALRAGPSLGAYALGYDLCCDGWDEAYRRKVVQAILNYNEGPHMSLEELARGKRQNPGSNHWGAEIGGSALALLAIRGDSGADAATVETLLADNAKCFLRNLTEGWGDHGFFAEGDGPGTISSDTIFVPALQAWRVAGGKDFISPRPNAQWMTLKWVMLTLPSEKGPQFPLRGVYGHNVYARKGMSGSGTFCQGFGAVEDRFKPALLWTYNHCIAPNKPDYDTVNPYPHRAVLALVNWPLGQAEANPGTVLPRAVEDKKFAFYMFRNKWEGPDDIVVTALLKSSRGNYRVSGGEIMIWGLGRKSVFPVRVTGEPTFFEATVSGGVVSTSMGSLGVDFSGASGAQALLVLAGPVEGTVQGGKGDTVQTISTGTNHFVILTLQKGTPPVAKAEGDAVRIGEQGISYDGKRIRFGK